MAIEIIAPGKVSRFTYDMFAAGAISGEEKNTIINQILEEEEYFITLLKDESTRQWFIWCSTDFNCGLEFESFWLVFSEEERERAEKAQAKLKAYFDERYFLADAESFQKDLQPIFDEIENEPQQIERQSEEETGSES